MSALAQLLHADGKQVSGSDRKETSVTDRLQRKGITVRYAQDGIGLDEQTDLFIYTSAILADHPERRRALDLGMRSISYFEAIGEYMRAFKNTIAVSGTHGKSTTTAMIANILVAAGMNPTVIVGSVVKEFESNARAGSKDVLVVEADEHEAHMLHLRPHMIVLTNIEADHLDYYRDLDHIVLTFQKYLDNLPESGVLFKNVDDSESQELGCDGTVVTYGIDHPAQVSARLQRRAHTQCFTSNGTAFELQIPGRFNVLNALAAIAVARHLHIPEQVIVDTLHDFHGVWRRFEIMGHYRGATVISDYAHHPTAVHSTIKAAREFYPGRRLVAVFQPHQRSRTKKLFSDFTKSFSEADFVIIQEIYDVAGREQSADTDISSGDLVAAVEQTGKYALYSADIADTRRKIDAVVEKNDVLLIMGAGDIYTLAEELAS